MTQVVPTLKKDSTRSLCDQFTNIFYVDETPSSIDMALAMSASQKSLQQDTAASSLDLASFASISYPSPAASSEESDDTLLVDSLSPPSSPWFPSMSTAGSISSTYSRTSKAAADASAVGEDVDFFRNPFYRSLHGHQDVDSSGVQPQSLFVQRRKVSLPQAVKSSRDRSSSGQVSQTAAPSDLFNVSLDQILSAGPLNLSLETQQMLFSAVEEAFPSSQKDGSYQQTPCGSSSSQEESDVMEDTLTTGSLSAPEDTEDDDVELVEYVQRQHQHGAECSQESELDDPSDSDYRESAPVQQKKARSSAANKKKTPRGASSTTTGKAPRVRKGTYKRSLKVYPPRRPKVNIDPELKMESDDCEIKIKTEPYKDHGIKLPGGLKLPLDKDGYLCEFCPKERFGRVHDLKRHQISKHNERTWPCDFCHRPFVRRDALLRHYAVKTARKDGVHPTAEDVDRLSEARARARLI
ncbi:hypothetical protein EC991_010424 [Linnemannia zychae]|nr:hypothetical protein EC991_010424 [Linnemannia zychae]